MEKPDYIIVGGGSAGCVLANRLSANPKTQVMLIETGGNDNSPWFKIPVGYYFLRETINMIGIFLQNLIQNSKIEA